MPRIAYLDIIGGISGDMLLAAMLDVGLDSNELERKLAKVVPVPFKLSLNKTTRGAVSATHVDVISECGGCQPLEWRDFDRCIDGSTLDEPDLTKIRAVFKCLREAEAEAHHSPEGTTHLHELGTLDTLIDIAGAVVGLRMLGVERLHASPLPNSIGMSSSSHGRGPSIAPATMSIIKNANLPVHIGAAHPPVGESITPTGAAIVATLATFEVSNMTIDSVGYGAGTRNSDIPPNVIGLWLGQSADKPSILERTAEDLGVMAQTDVFLIEANLDDMSGEEVGHAMQALFDVGALDVWTSPIQMKKSRPAVILSAIVKESDLNLVASTFFAQTSTLGVRLRGLERLVAERRVITVATEYGDVRVKLRRIGGVVTQIAPEYDDCAKLASNHGVSLRHVMDTAKNVAAQYIDD